MVLSQKTFNKSFLSSYKNFLAFSIIFNRLQCCKPSHLIELLNSCNYNILVNWHRNLNISCEKYCILRIFLWRLKFLRKLWKRHWGTWYCLIFLLLISSQYKWSPRENQQEKIVQTTREDFSLQQIYESEQNYLFLLRNSRNIWTARPLCALVIYAIKILEVKLSIVEVSRNTKEEKIR